MQACSILTLIASMFYLCCVSDSHAAEIQGEVKLHKPQPAIRRPTSMSWGPDDSTLYITNPRTGSLSILNIQTGESQEVHIGGEPLVVRKIQNGEKLAVLDAATDSVRFLSTEPLAILPESCFVGRGVSDLTISPDGTILAASSIWDRKVSFISIKETPVSLRTLSLAYEPGTLCFHPNGEYLLALDAFGGQITVIEIEIGLSVCEETLQGHQLRGCQFLSDHSLMIAHQILHYDSPTTGDNIAAGLVIENVFQELNFEFENQVSLTPRLITELGVPSHGAADPGDLLILSDDKRWMTFAGVNEVGILNEYGVLQDRLDVGSHPVALVASADEDHIYCLNQFSETVSVIDAHSQTVINEWSLGPPANPSPSDRGEELFFDGHMSRFGWFSCQSCHVRGHTNGLLADTFGDGTAGAPKRVLSLLGGRDNNPWAWNGSMRSLHDQVLKSGDTSMRGPGFSAKEANDLVAYLHRLKSPPPYQPAQSSEDQALISQGKHLFYELGCVQCHVPPLTYTSDSVYDVGIEDEHGARKFNPPTLIGAGYRRSFFHDGRAKSLRDVFTEYGHQLDKSLSEEDLQALVRFIESL